MDIYIDSNDEHILLQDLIEEHFDLRWPAFIIGLQTGIPNFKIYQIIYSAKIQNSKYVFLRKNIYKRKKNEILQLGVYLFFNVGVCLLVFTTYLTAAAHFGEKSV